MRRSGRRACVGSARTARLPPRVSSMGRPPAALVAFRSGLQEHRVSGGGAGAHGGVLEAGVSRAERHGRGQFLANRRDVRQRSGKKTDKNDATWRAARLAHGPITPSVVPPPQLRAFRDLTRTRVSLVQTRTQAKNRVDKRLEDTNSTLAHVVVGGVWQEGSSEVGGVGGRRARPAKAFGHGAWDVASAEPQREVALEGQCPGHHAKRMGGALELVDVLRRQSAEIEQHRQRADERDGVAACAVGQFCGGQRCYSARSYGRDGPDKGRFGSASRLASWAGLSPGTTKGRANAARVDAQGQCCLAGCWCGVRGRRATSTFLGRTFRRLAAL